MANTKQAKKMIRKTKRKTAYNKWWKNKVKEALKSLDIKNIQKVVDKAAKNGIIKKNKANRLKSSAVKRVAANG